MDGLIVIDKPSGCTSHDVVLRVRKLLNFRRVGHGGTLDPEATGVLLVLIGQATRFFPYLTSQDKTYEGRIRFGYSTDTYDSSGQPSSEESHDFPSGTAVAAAMKKMAGVILQVPPAYSAKKLHGQPVHKLARAGKEFTLEPSRVVIRAFRLTDYAPPFLSFEVECSSGTYIRSLAHDLGQALGCGAHLDRLRRTSTGGYFVNAAVSLERLEEAAVRGDAGRFLIPLEALLPDIPALVLGAGALDRIANGSPVFPDQIEAASRDILVHTQAPLFRLLDPAGKLRALARMGPERDRLHPFLVIQ